jgi:putative addiction module killer protein
MESKPRIVERYKKTDGRVPVDDWFHKLKDAKAKKAITDRLIRVELGSFGHVDNAGEGVLGLKIDVGPGYRVYFGQDGQVLVVLLCGGEKHGQDRDIATAKKYWADYKAQKGRSRRNES